MINETKVKPFTLLALAGLMITAIWLSGCGSDLDADFEPFSTGAGFHPFEEIEDHGAYLASNMDNLSKCMECHGSDLRGIDNGVVTKNGEKDRSCYECHNSDNHQVMFDSARRDHRPYLREHGWDLNTCYTCHTNTTSEAEFSFGGSCGKCHSSSPTGPQACNTCHGNFVGEWQDTLSWAPPKGLLGEESRSDLAVGAHQAHLTHFDDRLTKPTECSACHNVPDEWDSDGHISGDGMAGRAEVVFGFPANADSAQPVYNYDTGSCSASYCHGGKEADWTSNESWSSCGSCHAIPPAEPHVQFPTLQQCTFCHSETIDADGIIIAPDLHVNGVVNMSGTN